MTAPSVRLRDVTILEAAPGRAVLRVTPSPDAAMNAIKDLHPAFDILGADLRPSGWNVTWEPAEDADVARFRGLASAAERGDWLLANLGDDPKKIAGPVHWPQPRPKKTGSAVPKKTAAERYAWKKSRGTASSWGIIAAVVVLGGPLAWALSRGLGLDADLAIKIAIVVPLSAVIVVPIVLRAIRKNRG